MFDTVRTARITVEAETPLALKPSKPLFGTGLEFEDFNGLPQAPGHAVAAALAAAIEGCREGVPGPGSNAPELLAVFSRAPEKSAGEIKLSVSAAAPVESGDRVVEGISSGDRETSSVRRILRTARREFHRAERRGKTPHADRHEMELLRAGVRLKFELELRGDASSLESDTAAWREILGAVASPFFRLGHGTGKGFGKLAPVSVEHKVYDLRAPEGFQDYLEKIPSLSAPLKNADRPVFNKRELPPGWAEYRLDLRPRDFYLFGSGRAGGDFDSAQLCEEKVIWSADGKPSLGRKDIVFPASAVRGSLAAAVAARHNRIRGVFAEDTAPEELARFSGSQNTAVRALFGFADDEGRAFGTGNVIIGDVFIERAPGPGQVFRRAASDRFSGAAVDGTGHAERLVSRKEETVLRILVREKVFSGDDGAGVREAFELALKDICGGLVPLGAGAARGHGFFSGALFKNSVEIK
jgi:hypothetical protein